MDFIVASTIRHAETTASIDWKWLPALYRGSQRSFRVPGGGTALCCSHAERLCGLRADVYIYLAYQWNEVPHIREALAAHVARGGKVIDGYTNEPWRE